MSLATSNGSRLLHGDITSPFPSSGNEGHLGNRDSHYLLVIMSYELIDIGGPWKEPQPEPHYNPVALQKNLQAATFQINATQWS